MVKRNIVRDGTNGAGMASILNQSRLGWVGGAGVYLLPRGIAPDLIGVAGKPINSATDINVIAEAAGSCQNYDPLFEKPREGGAEAERRGTV